MKNTYKFALEFILRLCEKGDYNALENIKGICEMVLVMGESGDEDVCA